MTSHDGASRGAAGSGGEASGGATGSGRGSTLPDCEPLPGENSGAKNGPLSIRGQVTDADGTPVPNVPIALSGNAEAQHITNLLGSYTMRVDTGAYTLSLADASCSVAPDEAELTLADSSLTQDFSSLSDSCSKAASYNVTSTSRSIRVDNAWITNFSARDHGSLEVAEGQLDLFLSSPRAATACSFSIGSFTGYEKRFSFESEFEGVTHTNLGLDVWLTRGSLAVVFATTLAEGASEEQIRQALVLIRNLSEEDLDELLEGP